MLFIFLCLCGEDLFLFSPFSSRPLSEVLLGKLQHVVLAVVQRSLIQVSIDEPIQRNPLLSQKAVITEVPFYFITLADEKKKKQHLYGLINFVGSHCGRHGYGHSRGRRELTRSSPRLCRSVQWQRQEVWGCDWVDALSREGAGAAEHSAELPAWHTERRDQESNLWHFHVNCVG